MKKQLALFCLAIFSLRAQTLAFEVASVKPADPDARGANVNRGPGGRFTAENASLRGLITFAWDLRDDRLINAPAWIDVKRFNLEAKPPGADATIDQLRLMMQTLLADRFGMKVHKETRVMSAYILSVDKGGPKIQPAAQAAADERTGIRGDGRGNLTIMKTAIPLFAAMLSKDIGQSVIDETGLTGVYDFTLHWTPDTADPADSGLSIFTAVREQLGLRLEQKKVPSEVVVIDSIESTPSQN